MGYAKLALSIGARRMEQESKRDASGQCALCGKPFAGGDDSREHIIPNAIGGRKKVAGFLCRDCNSTTGQIWDSDLARQLNPICNLLGIKRERGDPPTIVVDTVDGKRLRHESNGRMTRHDVAISAKEIDGKIHLSISGPSKKEIKKHLPGLVRKYPQLRGVDLLSQAVASSEYSRSPIGIDAGFGGLTAGRSVVKSCAALAHVAGVRLDDLEQAREYLRGEDAPCFGYYNEQDVVLNRPRSVFFHCVHVQGNDHTGKVVAYVEYFGYMRMVALLSEAYRGPGFTETCAVDPVAGTEIEVTVNLPDFSTHDIQEIYDYKKVDFDICRKAIEPLLISYGEKSRKQELWSIVNQAFDHAGENCGVKLGDRIPEEQRARFKELAMERLSERLTAFVTHQREVPAFKNIDQDVGGRRPKKR